MFNYHIPDHHFSSYRLFANCDQVPTKEEWAAQIREATPEDALRLLDYANFCLARNVQDQRWGLLIGIAERILRERRIRFQ